MKSNTHKLKSPFAAKNSSTNKFRVASIGLLCISASIANAISVAMFAPGDAVVGIDSDGNGNAGQWSNAVERLVDGVVIGNDHKALNGGAPNSGFIITASNPGILNSWEIWTANDVPGRDPSSWEIYGTNDAITSVANDDGTQDTWTLLGSGTLALPADRHTSSGEIAITGNTTSYSSYKILFPTVKSEAEMQIAELQFYTDAAAIPEPSSAILLGLGSLVLMRRRRA